MVQVFRLHQSFKCNGQHGVSSVDGRGQTMLHVNRIPSASHLIVVHDVVVDQCEIVHGFDRCADVEQASMAVTNGFGDEPRKRGSHAFPLLNEVHHGVTQSFMSRRLEAGFNTMFDQRFGSMMDVSRRPPALGNMWVTSFHVVDAFVAEVCKSVFVLKALHHDGCMMRAAMHRNQGAMA